MLFRSQEKENKMSDMRKLLESVTKFSFANPKQKPGDQVRGTDKARKDTKRHPFAGRLVGANESADQDVNSLAESLMNEYKFFVEEPAPGANQQPGNPSSPTPQQKPGGLPQNQNQPQQAQAPDTQDKDQDPQEIQQQMAMQQKTKQDINSHLSQIKSSVDPGLNVPKVTQAFDKLQKNPNAQLTPDDTKQLAHLTQTMEPVLANSTGTSNLKNLIRKMTDIQTAQQAKMQGGQ